MLFQQLFTAEAGRSIRRTGSWAAWTPAWRCLPSLDGAARHVGVAVSCGRRKAAVFSI